MILGFFILLAFQLIGEILARSLALPAPGPVVGLALLVGALAVWRAWRPFDDEALANSALGRTADSLLGVLSFFFVPAGVGVVQYVGLLREQAVALGAALLISTLLTMAVTVGVFVLVKRLIGLRREA